MRKSNQCSSAIRVDAARDYCEHAKLWAEELAEHIKEGHNLKHIIWGVLFAFFCSAVAASAQASGKPDIAASVKPTAGTSAANQERALKAYGTLPLSFEANQGQTADVVRFLARGDGYTLFLTPTGAVLTLPEASGGANGTKVQSPARKSDVLRMELQGARPNALVEGADELPGKSNYFIGNDPKKWHVGVPTFRRVEYKNPYPGIELAYYGNKRELEYDFIVAPEADPNLIRLKIDGASSSQIDKSGNLFFRVGDKSVQYSAPNVYQDDGNKRSPVEGRWLASGKEFRFALGAYDHHKALVIDPKVVPAVESSTVPLAFSTYLGGSQTDAATSVTQDSNGNIYIAGHTNSSDFPQGVNTGAFPTYLGTNGSNNAFVAELDPTGSTLFFSSYLGGNNGDTANGIAVDANSNVYLVGTTFSGNFPVPSAFQPTCAGNCTDGDAFVTEFAQGGGSLIFSSFLGGTGFEQGNGIALSPQGLVYVVGWTSSTDFPTAGNAHQTANAGSNDAFLSEIIPPETGGAQLLYSTYLGGNSDDVATAIAMDSTGNAYMVGFTWSANFPTVAAEQGSCGGCVSGLSSAFVTKFDTKNGIAYSTFLGGTSYPSGNSTDVPCGQTTGTGGADQACGVAVDSSGNAYVAGATISTNFPTVNAFQSSCANSCTLSDGFVTKLNSTGSAITYSTYLGGSGDDRATAIAVDSVGNAFVTGQTSSTNFPQNNGFVVQGSCASCAGGGHDAFVAELAVPGTPLIYSSYLGGTTTQSGLGIAVSSADQAVVTGGTKSSDFPIASSSDSGAFQTQFGGVEDAFLTEFPEGVTCTLAMAGSPTGSNMSVNGTVTCFGNFVGTGDSGESLGFSFEGGGAGSGSGCGTCQTATGSATFLAPLTFPSTGTISVSPTANDQFGVQVVTTGFSVNVAVPVVSVATTTLGAGLVGTAYSQQVSAINGATPYTWSVASGALPPGLTLTAATGSITGTPSAAGTSAFTVQVKDANTTTNTQALSISVTLPALVITTTSLAPGVVGVAYTETLTASGGTTPYAWSVSTGSLPAGLTLTASTGVIGGTPTTAETSSFTVQVKDSASNTAAQALSIVDTTAPVQLSVLTTTLPNGTINMAYPSTTLQAGGGTPPYTWSVSSGTLPVGMSLSAQGVVSGTPNTGGTFDFTVQVTDSVAGTATQQLSIAITPPTGAPTCLPPTIGVGSNSNPLMVSASSNCSDSAGTLASTSINWGDGSKPLSGTSGSHTYASAGAYTITVTATDTNSLSATATGNVTVNAAVATAVPQGGSLPPQTSNVTAPPGVPSVGVTYTCTSVNGPSGSQPLSAYGLACTVNPSQVTLTSTPTAVQITVTTTGTSSLLQPGLRRGGAGWLYAAILPMPGIALMGIGCWPLKRRRETWRYVGLGLVCVLLWVGLGCGGTPRMTTTQPAIATPAGSYAVTVTGTNSGGTTSSTITVGFSVTVGG